MIYFVFQAVEKMKRWFGVSPSDGVGSQASSDEDCSAIGRCDNVYDFDENKDRGNWAGRFDFVLALLGSVDEQDFACTDS